MSSKNVTPEHSRHPQHQIHRLPPPIPRCNAQIRRPQGGVGGEVEGGGVAQAGIQIAAEERVHLTDFEGAAEEDAGAQDGGDAHGAVAVVEARVGVAFTLERADLVGREAQRPAQGEELVARQAAVEVRAAGEAQGQDVVVGAEGEVGAAFEAVDGVLDLFVEIARLELERVALGRQPGAVELVDVRKQAQPSPAGADAGQEGGAGIGIEADAPHEGAEADLTVAAEVHAQVQPHAQAVCFVAGDALVADEVADLVEPGSGVRADEEAPAIIHRLVELGMEFVAAAAAGTQNPLRTALVEPGSAVLHNRVEVGFAREIRAQADAEAKVAGAPALFARAHDQHTLAVAALNAVVDGLEIAAAIDAAHVGGEHVFGQEHAGAALHLVVEHLRPGADEALELDAVHHPKTREGGLLALANGGVLVGWQAVTRQLVGKGSRSLLADRDGFTLALEARRADVAQRRLDEHVLLPELGKLAIHRTLAQHVDELRGDRERGVELAALHERRLDVHRDDHIGAQAARLVDRQVVGDAAIHEQPPANLHWRHRARDGHAGAHRLRQAAVREQHGLAGFDVGGQGAEGDGQAGEILHVRHRPGQAAQEALDLYAADQPRRHRDTILAQAELDLGKPRGRLRLAPQGLLGARRAVVEDVAPVGGEHRLLELASTNAGRIGAADDGAHAGAGDAIHRHAQGFEHLEHADVRRTPRAAARERQADEWA